MAQASCLCESSAGGTGVPPVRVRVRFPAMTTGTDTLRCMKCGYDLRVHAEAEHCPECGTCVDASRRYAAGAADRQTQRTIAGVVVGLFLMHLIWNIAARADVTAALPDDIAMSFVGTWTLHTVLYIRILAAAARKASMLNLILLGTGIAVAAIAAVLNLGLWQTMICPL